MKAGNQWRLWTSPPARNLLELKGMIVALRCSGGVELISSNKQVNALRKHCPACVPEQKSGVGVDQNMSGGLQRLRVDFRGFFSCGRKSA